MAGGIIWDDEAKAPARGIVWDSGAPQPDLARETARGASMRGRPEPPSALPEFGEAYRQYVAKPLTAAVEPAVRALQPPESLRRILGPMYEQRVAAAKTQGYELPSSEELPGAIARELVPQTPIEAGAMVGTAVGGPIAPLLRAVPGLRYFGRAPAGRILGGALGGEAGGLAEGADIGQGALIGGGGAIAGEVIGGGGGAITRRLPGAKSRISERQARELRDVMESINPAVREPIEQAVISPELRGPIAQTPARLKRANESGALQTAVSQRMQGHIDTINQIAGNPTFSGAPIERAFRSMPALAREDLVQQFGPPMTTIGAQGQQILNWSLPQVQAIRSWVSSSAFAASPRGQGVAPGPQQRLVGRISDIIDARLGRVPKALTLWRQANREYGVQALMEALTRGGTRDSPFSGAPNRIQFTRSPLSEYMAENEEDLVRRFGREHYDQLVEGLLSGGQPGTRDFLTPGAGTMGEAARQSIGRGTNTGSVQAIGLPLRTALPNLGSQYTGRAPYTLPPALQAILDVALQRMGGAALNPEARP